MDFKDRLKDYRERLGIKTKSEMAERIGIKRNLYSMLENGKREPSKDVLRKLLIASKEPEEYWLYGITNKNAIIKRKYEFKYLNNVMEQLERIELFDANKELPDEVKKILLAAAIADVTHILEKKKLKDNER